MNSHSLLIKKYIATFLFFSSSITFFFSAQDFYAAPTIADQVKEIDQKLQNATKATIKKTVLDNGDIMTTVEGA
jgi:hypothetical protein